MGKTIKYLFKIVIFPITIVFYLLRAIYLFIQKRVAIGYLKNLDISRIDSLDGIEFEEFLYYSFKSIGVKVEKTKSSRDYGADLVIEIDNQIIVVQSKLYFNHTVGNSAIQEIATARSHYKADLGIVITNSYFTKSAISLADSNNIRLMDRLALSDFLASDKRQKLEILSSWV